MTHTICFHYIVATEKTGVIGVLPCVKAFRQLLQQAGKAEGLILGPNTLGNGNDRDAIYTRKLHKGIYT